MFKRVSGDWQSVAYHETVIPGEIVPARVDPKVYDDYVGRYQLFAGYVYTITRSGDRLMFSSSVSGERELMPETDTTFVLKGGVTHLRIREFPGVEYNAMRMT